MRPRVFRVEFLEDRNLLAAAVPGVTLDPALVPKFVNPLNPNTLALGNTSFVYQPTGKANVTPADKRTANPGSTALRKRETAESVEDALKVMAQFLADETR